MSGAGKNIRQASSNITSRTTNKTKKSSATPPVDPELVHEESFSSSPAVTTSNDPRELRNIISILQNKIDLLSNKVDHLNSEVATLKHSLCYSQAVQAVAQQTSSILQQELDKHEQYSRRNCLVFDGIPASRNDGPDDHTTKAQTLLTEQFPSDGEIITSFDKAHPIGQVKDGKQSFIMRFSKHSVVSRIYRNRNTIKKSTGITLRPSLTKKRSATLRACQKIQEHYKFVKFTYADLEGNLKVCFNTKLDNRFIHTFESEDHFYDLMLQYDHVQDYGDNDNDNVTGTNIQTENGQQ